MTADRPFAPLHSRASFLETRASRETLDRLADGLGAREPFLLLTGEPGTGKTALVHEAIARWDARITPAFLACTALAAGELLEEIVRRLGAEPPEGASHSRLVACFERVLAEIADRGQVALVVVDDAHDLPVERLEELRLLVNAAQQSQRPVEVLLVGLPSLAERLADSSSAIGQRISVRAHTAPLSAADTQRYLHHRVTAAGGDGPGLFSRRTCRDIAALTHGVPRAIDTLASEALRITRAAAQPTVTPEHVRAAAATLWGVIPERPAHARRDAAPAAEVAPVAPVAAPAPAVAPAPAPAAAAAPVAAVPVAVPEPKTPPPPPAPVPAPRAERTADAPGAAEHVPPRVVPAAQDKKEWVARFVGSSGPLQIGSRAYSESSRWETESADARAVPPRPARTPAPEALPGPQSPATAIARARRKRPLRVPVGAALAGIVVVSLVALLVRAGRPVPQGARTAPAANKSIDEPSAQRTGGPAPVANVSEAPVVTRVVPGAALADAGARGGAPPPATERRSRASDAAERKAATAIDEGRRFTIDVGGYLDLARATEVRDRLRSRTGIDGWVVTTGAPGQETHRIVLGIFHSCGRALSAAEVLLADDAVPEAQVIPLPPRGARR